MYQHTSSFVVVMNVGRVGYLKEVPVSLVQSSGCGVGGVSVRGGCVGVAVQIGGVGVGGADVGGGRVASVGGAYVSPTIHVISKLLCSQPPALKLMYISPPLLL